MINIYNVWKPINGYEHYLISVNGEIFNTRTGKIKKSSFDYKGYKRVRLINGRNLGSTKKVHRLVAEAFLDNYSSSLQVNHKNCVKHDNRLSNLEMATQSQNTKHAWDNGRMKLSNRDSTGKFISIKNKSL